MSVRIFGIYLAYLPRTKLQGQGLGRYLAAFLKAACEASDVRFVVACPSWLRRELIDLCEVEGVDLESFDILSPGRESLVLRALDAVDQPLARLPHTATRAKLLRRLASRYRAWLGQLIARAQDTPRLVVILIDVCAIAVLSLPLVLALAGRQAMLKIRHTPLRGVLRAMTGRLRAAARRIVDLAQLRQAAFENEQKRLLSEIARRPDIQAWYCPTAFWPSFNEIKAPRLMCVPDLVPAEFPIGFARIASDESIRMFEACRRAIARADKLITYSDRVKWEVLVDMLGTPARRIEVVPHAANDLSPWVTISGGRDDQAASRGYARSLLAGAFQKSSHPDYAATFLNTSVKFIFYASQFRPSKNVVTLLRAYNDLLKHHFIEQKLILTGLPSNDPEVSTFITDHGLENDVLCLSGLTVAELAACYALADLAVNPSLSEGGCPFTLTEALSVGTPVIMARIPVTEEVVTDPALQRRMLFDPYRWEDLAEKIVLALQSRAELLGPQMDLYARLSQRTWRHVVDEHVAILSAMADAASSRRIPAA